MEKAGGADLREREQDPGGADVIVRERAFLLIGRELHQLRPGRCDDVGDGRDGERELLLFQPADALVPRSQLAPGAAADVVERFGRELGVHAGVHEDAAVDLGEDGLRPEPAPVASVRLERLAVLDIPDRVLGEPRRFVEASLGAESRRRLKGPLAPGLRVAVGEAAEDLRRRIARVGDEVHHFVVPEQDLDAAARRGGLRLERHEQVERRAHARAAIHHVAGLDERRLAAGPALLRVDQAGADERRRQPLGGAVHVADRHDAPGGLGLPDRVEGARHERAGVQRRQRGQARDERRAREKGVARASGGRRRLHCCS